MSEMFIGVVLADDPDGEELVLNFQHGAFLPNEGEMVHVVDATGTTWQRGYYRVVSRQFSYTAYVTGNARGSVTLFVERQEDQS